MQAIVNVNIPGWGIGAEGKLLSHISADMKRFAALTTGGTVIYGRKTLETFPGGRPLKNRENIILTRRADFSAGDAKIVHSLERLRALCRNCNSETLWVIGGESVYRALLPYCAAVRVTRSFDAAVPADAFFPNLDALPNWHIQSEGPILDEAGKRYQFADYENTAVLPL